MEILVVAIFLSYWIVVEVLKKNKILERFNITAYGPILMIRTSKLLNLMERLSKAKNVWIVLAEFGFFTIFAGMVFMMILVVIVDYIVITSPPEPSEYTDIRAALIIPGINPFIPLVWGLIGLIVTLVVHEFSHAILCRVEKIKVKSIGILLALIPIGGFAEPDDEDLKKSKIRSKLRVYSAGISANFVVSFASFASFFFLLSFVNPTVSVWDENGFVGVVREVNGNPVKSIEDLKVKEGSLKLKIENKEVREVEVPNVWGVKVLNLLDGPAKDAGIKPGDLLVSLDNKKIHGFEDFRRTLSEKKPGDFVEVEVYRNAELLRFNLKLSEREGRAFMGVMIYSGSSLAGYIVQDSRNFLEDLKSIPQMALNPVNWLILISLPFKFQGFVGDYEKIFDGPRVVFYLLNSLYWIFWINFYVALFNCLPAIPLDGGRFFQEVLAKLTNQKLASDVVKFLSFFIFFSIVFILIAPYL